MSPRAAALDARCARSWSFCAIVLAAAASSCGRYEEAAIEVTKPFSSASVARSREHGTVHLVVDPQHTLEDAAALSRFGALRPGMTVNEAVEVLGPPQRVVTDSFGEQWSVWRLDELEARVGCRFGCSGSPPDHCKWVLEGTLEDPTMMLSHAAKSALVKASQLLPSEQTEVVISAGYESLNFRVKRNATINWIDTRTVSRRLGPPRNGVCP